MEPSTLANSSTTKIDEKNVLFDPPKALGISMPNSFFQIVLVFFL